MCSFAAPPSPSPHPIVCTSVTRPVRPSPCQSVERPVRPSSCQPPPSLSITHKSVALSVRPMASPSVIPTHLSYKQSVHPPVTPSMTRQSATQPVSPVKRLLDPLSLSDHLYSILPHPSGCSTSSDCTSTILTDICPSRRVAHFKAPC